MSERNFWMIGADSRVYGPADVATMTRWIAEGRVTAATQVAASPDGPWNDAGSQPELASHFGSAPGAGVHAGSQSAGAPPSAHAAPPREPVPGAAAAIDWPPSNLQGVLLASGIINIVWGAGGAVGMTVGFMCMGCLCGLPWILTVVMGIVQCMDYSAALRMERSRYLERTQLWGILNLVVLITGNLPAAVCGILQLVWLSEARRRAFGA